MSLKFSTIPQKRLLQGISSSATSFYLDNILSFDGLTDVAPSDLGSVHYCAFRNDTGTVLELMEIDPATISSGPITINKRGLSFYGDLTTQDTDLKLDWPANTIVMLGTDVPQIFQWLKEYVDNTAFNGAPDASTTVKGIVEEATDEQIVAGTDTGETGAKLFAPPSKMNTQIQAKIVTDRVRTTTATSSATPTIDTDTYNRLTLTAQAVDITSMTTNLSGTPVDGQKLQVVINPTNRNPAISYVAEYNTNTSGTDNLTLNKPTGTVDGDIIFAIFYSQYSDPAVNSGSIPSGWTKLTSSTTANGPGLGTYKVSVFYKIASSEPSDYTWYWYTNMTKWGQNITYRGGFNPTNPVLNTSKTAYTTSNTTNRAASFAVDKENSTLVFIGLNGESATATPPSGFTEHYDGNPYLYIQHATKVNIGSGFTGDIDATLSASGTAKLALCIALNPELDITWGASFASRGDFLPTKAYGPNPTIVDFQYNSDTSRWETTGPMIERSGNIVTGLLTKDISSTTTSTIAHGFGRKPKIVRMRAVYSTSSSIAGANSLVLNDTQVSHYFYADTGTGTGEETGTSFSLLGGTSSYLNGIITTDSVNVNIVWEKTGTPTGSIFILYEIEI